MMIQPPMLSLVLVLLLSLLIACGLVEASRDDSYYSHGARNPNLQNPLYYRFPQLVVDDIDLFRALYVRFHSCVWTEMLPDFCRGGKPRHISKNAANNYYGGNKNKNNNNNKDNNNHNRALGNDNNNNNKNNKNNYDVAGNAAEHVEYDLWYIGANPCERANVAYSLYGIYKEGYQQNSTNMYYLSDEENKEHRCTEATYINTFYTTAGVETYVKSMVEAGEQSLYDQDGKSVTSYCATYWKNYTRSSVATYQLAERGDDDKFNPIDEAQTQTGEKLWTSDGWVSSTIACSGSYFVRQQFSGATCDGHDGVSVAAKLDGFNKAIQSAGCVQIYDSNREYYYWNYENFGNMRGPINILSYSRACSPHDLTGKCIDPYGKTVKYTRALDGATQSVALTQSFNEDSKWDISWAMFAGGMILLMVSGLLVMDEMVKERRRRRWMSEIEKATDQFGSARAISPSTIPDVLSYPSFPPPADQLYADVLSQPQGRSPSSQTPFVAMTGTAPIQLQNSTAVKPPANIPKKIAPLVTNKAAESRALNSQTAAATTTTKITGVAAPKVTASTSLLEATHKETNRPTPANSTRASSKAAAALSSSQGGPLTPAVSVTLPVTSSLVGKTSATTDRKAASAKSKGGLFGSMRTGKNSK